jgi:vancomycin resistance protein VanJ
MTSKTPIASQGFWRCDRCGTPNPSATYVSTCLGCGSPRPPRGAETNATTIEPAARPSLTRWRILLQVSAAAYAAVVIAAIVSVRIVGDSFWPGLLLLMSPRWLFLVPALPIALVAWRLRRRLVMGMVVIEVLLVLGPLMGFVLPWGLLHTDRRQGPSLRVMTFNRGGGTNDIARLTRYLERHQIDVVCFQEFRPDPALDAYFDSAQWHRDSTRSIASRYPIVAELPRSTERNFDQARYTMTCFSTRIKGPGGREFILASIHLPTLRPGLNRFLAGDIKGLRLQAEWWNQESERLLNVVTQTGDVPTIVAGDFNMPIESDTLTSLSTDGRFQSAFDEAGWGWGFTRPATLPWVRIDHIFAPTNWKVRRCWVGPSFGSDHRSLIAEVAFPPLQSE